MDKSTTTNDALNKGSQPLIQVLIPVYNSAKYLDACFESLQAQTYPNWEAIVIDDSSNDELSPKKCDEWAAREPRIKVTHLAENKGVGFVRNEMLRLASAPWIGFLDSDDFIVPHHLELMMQTAQKHEATMVFTGYYPYQTPKGTRSATGLLPKDKVYDNREIIIRTCLDRNGMGSYLWRTLCRRELFEGVTFPEGRCFEDFSVFPLIIQNAQRIAHTGEATYYYRWVATSIVNNPTPKKLLDYVYACLDRMQFIATSTVLSTPDKVRLMLWPRKRILQIHKEISKLPQSLEKEEVLHELNNIFASYEIPLKKPYPYCTRMFLISIQKRIAERYLL